jgi:4-hydroxy-tetrahydrodipicolinate synthase
MSNMMTTQCARWTKLCADGKWGEAEADFSKYKQIISLMYCEANPIPLKWMMYKMGLMQSAEMRLPLMSLEKSHHETIFSEMKKLELV